MIGKSHIVIQVALECSYSSYSNRGHETAAKEVITITRIHAVLSLKGTHILRGRHSEVEQCQST